MKKGKPTLVFDQRPKAKPMLIFDQTPAVPQRFNQKAKLASAASKALSAKFS